MDAASFASVDFLYTNIGRGHPHYLDGIVECMPAEKVGVVTDVFAATSGAALQAWKLARFLYRAGASGGALSRLYTRLRAGTDFNRGGLTQAVMGAPLARRFSRDPTPLVVAHPLLVAVLAEKANLIYQHGEVTAPPESWVRGRHRVVVPLAQTADVFAARGFDSKAIFVSGLCIEPALASRAEPSFHTRIGRLSGADPLCGAFFSSGAEPREHVSKLAAAAAAAVGAGGRAVIFARRAGPFAAVAVGSFSRAKLELGVVDAGADLPGDAADAIMCLYGQRRELNELTARTFDAFDYVVAPAHERTHWALGLGLPMFVVEPAIGSYAPLNREALLAATVGRTVADRGAAARFGETLAALRRAGDLRGMAEAGWGRFETRGFHNISEFLQSRYAEM
jgi:hypothetical protein